MHYQGGKFYTATDIASIISSVGGGNACELVLRCVIGGKQGKGI